MNNFSEIRKKLTPIFKNYKIQKAGIFGSFVRDEARDDSDVDVVVNFSDLEDATDIKQIVGLKTALEEAFGRKVDLVQYKNLKKRYRPYIISEQVIIYDKEK